LATFKQSAIRGVWLRISIDNSSFIPIAIKVQSSSKLRGSEIAVKRLKKCLLPILFKRRCESNKQV